MKEQLLKPFSTSMAVVLVATGLAATAMSHGTPLHIDGAGGRLTASNGLALGPGFASMAFDPSEEAGLDFPGLTVRTDLPGFDVTGVTGATIQWNC
jgi:hypothetical protein